MTARKTTKPQKLVRIGLTMTNNKIIWFHLNNLKDQNKMMKLIS